MIDARDRFVVLPARAPTNPRVSLRGFPPMRVTQDLLAVTNDKIALIKSGTIGEFDADTRSYRFQAANLGCALVHWEQVIDTPAWFSPERGDDSK